jgi:hypothetical protein
MKGSGDLNYGLQVISLSYNAEVFQWNSAKSKVKEMHKTLSLQGKSGYSGGRDQEDQGLKPALDK